MSGVNSKNIIKTMMASRGYTQMALKEQFEEATGKSLIRQSFANKINGGRIPMSEFLVLCEIMGYEVDIKPKDGTDNIFKVCG